AVAGSSIDCIDVRTRRICSLNFPCNAGDDAFVSDVLEAFHGNGRFRQVNDLDLSFLVREILVPKLLYFGMWFEIYYRSPSKIQFGSRKVRPHECDRCIVCKHRWLHQYIDCEREVLSLTTSLRVLEAG